MWDDGDGWRDDVRRTLQALNELFSNRKKDGCYRLYLPDLTSLQGHVGNGNVDGEVPAIDKILVNMVTRTSCRVRSRLQRPSAKRRPFRPERYFFFPSISAASIRHITITPCPSPSTSHSYPSITIAPYNLSLERFVASSLAHAVHAVVPLLSAPSNPSQLSSTYLSITSVVRALQPSVCPVRCAGAPATRTSASPPLCRRSCSSACPAGSRVKAARPEAWVGG